MGQQVNSLMAHVGDHSPVLVTTVALQPIPGTVVGLASNR
jgi:hypothetical protein